MALQYFARLWVLQVGLSRLKVLTVQAARWAHVLSVSMGRQQQVGESGLVQNDFDEQLARVAGARASLCRVAQPRASHAPHVGQLAEQHVIQSFRALEFRAHATLFPYLRLRAPVMGLVVVAGFARCRAKSMAVPVASGALARPALLLLRALSAQIDGVTSVEVDLPTQEVGANSGCEPQWHLMSKTVCLCPS